MRAIFRIQISLALIFLSYSFSYSSGIVINEIMASNSESLYDEDQQTSDWIELYNASTEDVNLDGYKISDKNDPAKAWAIPDTIIKPGEYLIIYASGKDYSKSGSCTIETSGKGIDFNEYSDSFSFYYMKVEGDFDMSVRVHSMREFTWHYGSLGIIIREDTTKDSKYAGSFCTTKVRHLYESLFRNEEGIYPQKKWMDSFEYPDVSIRLKREGDTIRTMYWRFGYYWHQMEAHYYPPNKSAFLGLACGTGDHEQNTTMRMNISDLKYNGSPMNIEDLKVVEVNNNIPGRTYYTKEFHTDFKLDDKGETVYLWNNNNELLDEMSYEKLYADVSFGRFPDGEDSKKYSYPATPNAANENPKEAYTPTPEFSIEGGSFEAPVNLNLSVSDENADIYYSTNGLEPTLEATKYSGETINIDKTTIVRARAFRDGYYPGYESAFTFFINEDNYLPVISIGIDSLHLWDEKDGIFVEDFANLFSGQEKPLFVEFWETDKSRVFASGAGVKLHGNASRYENDQKTMRFYSRKKYGDSDFDYNFWTKDPEGKCDKFILRVGGQDWCCAFLRDPFLHVLSQNLTHLNPTAYRPCVAYINGEYWGLYNLRERIDEDLLAERYDVSTESINLMEDIDVLLNGESISYHRMLDSLINIDMTQDESYEYMKTVIDEYNLIDYLFASFYAATYDWPGKNMKYWNSSEIDARWRWSIYDCDLALGRNQAQPDLDMFKNFDQKKDDFSKMSRNLWNNEKYKNNLLNRFADLLNTEFTAERTERILDSLAAHIEDEIPVQRARWERSLLDWEGALEFMKNFIHNRPPEFRKHAVDYFKLPGVSDVRFSTNIKNAGIFQINTLTITDLPWDAVYFQGVPIEVTVIPSEGYTFVGWANQNLPKTETVVVDLPETYELTAIFKKDGEYKANIVINEIMYKPADDKDSKDWVELYNASEEEIDISEWTLKDDKDDHAFVFPEGTNIYPQSYLVVCNDSEMFDLINPGIENKTGDFDFGFGKDDVVRLYGQDGLLIDSVDYANVYPWDPKADGAGYSLELISHIFDNALAQSWKVSTETNGTPGRNNSRDTFVNEIPVSSLSLRAYPNPISDECEIEYSLDARSTFDIELYNSLGEIVTTLVNNRTRLTGNYSLRLNGAALSRGVYFLSLNIIAPREQRISMPIVIQ